MASLSTDPNGNRTIQFVGADGKRRSLRLGKVNKKLAESIKLKVEHLAAAAASRMPLDVETAAWVGNVGAELHGKLAAVGLVPRREASTLGAFLADYTARRRADGTKGSTIRIISRVATDLVAAFGGNVDVRAVTPTMADDLAAAYADRKLSNVTVAHQLKTCQMLFKNAVRRGLADRNPFAEVRIPSASPDPARKHYVTRDDARRVIDVCSPEWQVTVALSRFGGLRAPSEAFSLRWADVNLPAGRMVVWSPKTEHHPNGASRVVPIFPDLRPFLEDAFDRAGDTGAEYVVNGVGERARERAATRPDGWSAVSLGAPFGKMVARAGLAAWPRLVHNMRASCETDLMADHPIHVVCTWIGNTPKVALQHYLQTLEGDFTKALAKRPTHPAGGGADSGAPVVQKPVRLPAATTGRERHRRDESTSGEGETAESGRPVPVGAGARMAASSGRTRSRTTTPGSPTSAGPAPTRPTPRRSSTGAPRR